MSLDKFERGVDRHIQQAQEAGAFDNLPGKGKPLKLDNNPLAPPETQAAYKLLNDNEFLLPWMEKGQAIDKALEAARAALARGWDSYLINREKSWAAGEWERTEAGFRKKVEEINKMIRDYNLEIPNIRFERFRVSAEKEIAKVREG